jgi:hypothetical protein
MYLFTTFALLGLVAVGCAEGDRADLPANRDYNKYVHVAAVEPAWAEHVEAVLAKAGIPSVVEGSRVYGVRVPPGKKEQAVAILKADVAKHGYRAVFPTPGPFLGVPEDRARKFEDENPGLDSLLRGITTMTEVQSSDYATYSRYKKDCQIANEEIRGGFVYFAVKEARDVPLAGSGGAADGAYITVTNRFKAPLPKVKE